LFTPFPPPFITGLTRCITQHVLFLILSTLSPLGTRGSLELMRCCVSRSRAWCGQLRLLSFSRHCCFVFLICVVNIRFTWYSCLWRNHIGGVSCRLLVVSVKSPTSYMEGGWFLFLVSCTFFALLLLSFTPHT
jgi:hypothetical protein